MAPRGRTRRVTALAAALWACAALGASVDAAASAPSASTGSASAVGRVSAVVSATVNPNGEATAYRFEYGTTTAYGSSTPDASAGAGTASQEVSASLGGLSGSTTYHYRVVATNAAGTTLGADRTFTTSAPYATNVLNTPGLNGYYRLNERSAPAIDSANKQGGTYLGEFKVGRPGLPSTNGGRAGSFDGKGYISLPASESLTSFTVEGWTKLSSEAGSNPNGHNALFGAGGRVRLLTRPDGAYAGVWAGGTEYRVNVPTESNVGTWVHWALVRDGSSLTLYRNGTAVGGTAGLPAGATSVGGSIAAQGGAAYFLHGLVDEVAVYGSALSAGTVQQHYSVGTGATQYDGGYRDLVLFDTPGMLHFWRMDDRMPAWSATGLHGWYRSDIRFSTSGDFVLREPGAIADDSNASVRFSGSDWVETASLGPAGTTFTAEGWTRLAPDAGASNALGYNALYGTGGAQRLLTRPDGVYASAWAGGTEYSLQASTPSNIETWVHWALVRDGTKLTLYRNGTAIGSRSDLPADAGSSFSNSVGAQSGSTYFLRGRVDEHATYTSALSPATIERRYLVGSGQ